MEIGLGEAAGIAAAGLAAKAVVKTTQRALKGPADSLSKHLGKGVDDWVQSLKDKRVSNLSKHVERAARIGGEEELRRVADEPAFADWADAVSRADPADRALSDIWQAALLSLQDKGLYRLRILTIAKSLGPDEAAAFLAISRRDRRALFELPNSSQDARVMYYQKFRELGLIRTPWQIVFDRIPIIAMSLSLAIGTVFYYKFTHPGKLSTQHVRTVVDIIKSEVSLSMIVILFIVVLIWMWWQRQQIAPKLSRDGRALRDLVDRVLDVEADQKDPFDAMGSESAEETKAARRKRKKSPAK